MKNEPVDYTAEFTFNLTHPATGKRAQFVCRNADLSVTLIEIDTLTDAERDILQQCAAGIAARVRSKHGN